MKQPHGMRVRVTYNQIRNKFEDDVKTGSRLDFVWEQQGLTCICVCRCMKKDNVQYLVLIKADVMCFRCFRKAV